MLVTVGGPENWKDKMAGGLDGTVPVLCTANPLGRGDWIRNTFRRLAIDYAAAKEPARTSQHFSLAAGDIADGQLRRRPRRQKFLVTELMK